MPVNHQGEFVDNRPDVKFNAVGGKYDGEAFVEFKYKQPSVSVSTSANFSEHDVFGDVTVRQKLGEKPDEISVEGMCTAEEANFVDQLIYQEIVELVSHRWSGVVHVASTSTDPITDGGGQDLEGDWLYSFTVECVEITEQFNDIADVETRDLLNLGEPSENGSSSHPSVGDTIITAQTYDTQIQVERGQVAFSGGVTRNSSGGDATAYFEYRPEGSGESWQKSSAKQISGTSQFEEVVYNLESDTPFEWRAVAEATLDDGSTARDTGEIAYFTTPSKLTQDVISIDTYDEGFSLSGADVTFSGGLVENKSDNNVDVFFQYRRPYYEDEWKPTNAEIMSSTGSFQKEVNNLEERVDFEWRAMGQVELDDGTKDSDTGHTYSFATQSEDVGDDKVIVATGSAETGDEQATLYGEVTDMVGVYKTEVSFEYRLEGDSTWTTTGYTQELTEPGTFNETVDALEGGTQSHEYRAVVKTVDKVSDYAGNDVDRGSIETAIF